MNQFRGKKRRTLVQYLSAIFSTRWPAYLGRRNAAYRALSMLGITSRLIAEAAGVDRWTVRTAIEDGGPVPVEVWSEARAALTLARSES